MAADKTRWSIGVDLGGTKIAAARVNEDGEIQDHTRVKTDVEGGYEAVQNQIGKLTHTLMDKADCPPLALGIGVAGQIDKESGEVSYAPNLNWKNVPLDANLEEKLDIPVTVLNDVRAAAWGEWLHGAGKDCDDVICIFVGTGVGGSIISEGTMLEGATNMAGEIGHMTVLLDGPECHCGNKGCLEALAGSWAIERDAKEAVKNNPKANSKILELADGKVEDIQAKMVIKACKEGDELAQKLMNDVAHSLAGGLTGLTNALNPERIIMGGGVIEHLPDLIGMIDKNLRKCVLDAALPALKIIPTQLHDDSGVIGAAAYTFTLQQEK